MTNICVSDLTITGSDNGLSWITLIWFDKSRAWSVPSHYLNQCWNIVNKTLRKKLQWNFHRNSSIFIQDNAFESVVCERRPFCLGLNMLKCIIFQTNICETVHNAIMALKHILHYCLVPCIKKALTHKQLDTHGHVLSSVVTNVLMLKHPKAPGHQYLQCWLNIHCNGLISYRNIAVMKNSRLDNKIRFWKKISC